METKKILVTGGAGLIGSFLCEKLVNMGNEVLCIDNLLNGSRENIRKLMFNPNFKFIEIDASFKIDVKVDEIYHLACVEGGYYVKKYPFEIATNVFTTYNMLKIALKNNAKLFFASSSEIYGRGENVMENYVGTIDCISKRAIIGETKRFSEMLCMLFFREKYVDVRIGRIFNVYGPKMGIDDGRVIARFVVSALRNNDIVVFGNGKQRRSFCFVDDVIDAIIRIMNSNKSGEVFNIAGDDVVEIRELAHIVRDVCKSKSKIVFRKTEFEDIDVKTANTEKIKKLGWEPLYDLRTGIEKTVNWFKDNIFK